MEKMESNKKEGKKKKFIEELRGKDCAGNVTLALRRTGFANSTMYLWKKEDKEFSENWDEAVREGKETFADEAEHALRGQVLRGNVTAAIFTLKCLRPEKWREKQILEHKLPQLPEMSAALKEAIYEGFKQRIRAESTPRVKSDTSGKAAGVGG